MPAPKRPLGFTSEQRAILVDVLRRWIAVHPEADKTWVGTPENGWTPRVLVDGFQSDKIDVPGMVMGAILAGLYQENGFDDLVASFERDIKKFTTPPENSGPEVVS